MLPRENHRRRLTGQREEWRHPAASCLEEDKLYLLRCFSVSSSKTKLASTVKGVNWLMIQLL